MKFENTYIQYTCSFIDMLLFYIFATPTILLKGYTFCFVSIWTRGLQGRFHCIIDIIPHDQHFVEGFLSGQIKQVQ